MDVIATRNESVRLSLQDDFTSGMARAAAATAILKKELKGLDGSKVSTDLDRTSDSVEKVGSASRKAGPDIDKFSGRLGLLVDAAIVGTPALIRLGAGTIPVLTGAMAGLGAAAGGVGVAALAFMGLGDALTALNTYQLEPTAQNLEALRIEQEKLGPSGTQFLRYIDDLQPALSGLQDTARAGLFPGVEAGIDDLLGRLPDVRNVISDLAQGLGDLAADAGASLGGDDFNRFFDYLATDARPTLDAFARSAGNVGLGLANLLVAFAPASRDFTGGLEDATEAFANFTKGLDSNASFQSFLAYIREAGPQTAEFAGAFIQAFAGIAEAAAPLGSVLLPALTGVLKALSAIATSPFGPAIYAGIAGFTALSRVSALAGGTLDRLSVSSDRTRSSLSRLASSGAGILAAGQAIGVLVNSFGDLGNAVNSSDIDRSITALGNGQSTAALGKLSSALEGINEAGAGTVNAVVSVGSAITGIKTSFTTSQETVEKFDQSLAQLVESGHADEAAAAFKQIRDAAAAHGGVSDSDVVKSFDAYNQALKNAGTSAAAAKPPVDYLQTSISNLAHGAFAEATNAAQAFSTSLAELNGWFDKRDALRAYGDSLDSLTQGLKNGFSREDEANIDAVGRSILQVAQNIKNPGSRANFLSSAREELVSMAKTSAPAAKKAIQEVIDKFDSKGLTNPPPIKLSADDKAAEAAFARTRRAAAQLSKTKAEPKVTADTAPAIQNFNQVDGRLDDLNGFTARTRVTADTSAAQSAISSVRSLLLGLNGTTATTYVRSIRVAERNAEGGYISGPGGPKDDAIPSWLSNGEYVMPAASVQKYGVGTFDKMRALRFAEGGPVSGGGSYVDGGDSDGIKGAAKGAAGALKVLEVRARRLENAQGKQEKKLDNLNQTLDNLTSARDSLSSSATSALTRDPFGNGLAGLQAQTAADTSDGSAMLTALKTLIGEGIDPKGALFQQLAASGDVTTAQQLAALSAPDALAQQAAFQQRVTVTSQVGQYAGQQSFGPDIKLQTKAVNEQRDVVRALNQTVRGVNQEIKHLKEEISRMKKHVKDGAKEGTREGQQDKDRTTHQSRRTGNR